MTKPTYNPWRILFGVNALSGLALTVANAKYGNWTMAIACGAMSMLLIHAFMKEPKYVK